MEKTHRPSLVVFGRAARAMPAASWVMATRVVLPTLSFIEPDTSNTARIEKSVVAVCQTSVAAATAAASGVGPMSTAPTLPAGVGIVTGTAVDRIPYCANSFAAAGVMR